MKRSNQERFDEKYIKVETGCWEWQGHLSEKGYGMFRLSGVQMGAHRASFILHTGDIPDKLLICHTCDNPRCVNPDHFFLGDYRDNNMDSRLKGRQALAVHGTSGMYNKYECRCEKCVKAESDRGKNYRKKNPEKEKARANKYYVANKEKKNEYRRKWRADRVAKGLKPI